jgi:hypothetical protein
MGSPFELQEYFEYITGPAYGQNFYCGFCGYRLQLPLRK